MKVYDQVPIIDEILEKWRNYLKKDYIPYKNHCCRVFNFCVALCGENSKNIQKSGIAAAFHDLGIWTDCTVEYLEPSRKLAREYLEGANLNDWIAEIEEMIEQHHKLTTYESKSGFGSGPDNSWIVEEFRKADLVDVSLGMIKSGLPSSFVREVLSLYPNEGFHMRLLELTVQRLKTHPFSPLPMMKL
ncbi:HD domain-containing protein [Desulforegula conservatrix]|uniref:HD domain-containing protein n=1 Tax=Desulforegula conservatrix TaxID=153026 RepID=UPI000422BC0D|nr:HD domain-containing protein [Desulforegula conservatrix]